LEQSKDVLEASKAKLEKKLPKTRGAGHWVTSAAHTLGAAHWAVTFSLKLHGHGAYTGHGTLGLMHRAYSQEARNFKHLLQNHPKRVDCHRCK